MKIKNSVKTNIILIFMILLVFKSHEVVMAAKSGLSICFSSVIPALFPFMVLSSAFVGNTGKNSFKLIRPLFHKLFGFSAYGTSVFICGIICGYPIGAKCTAELYRNKKISKSEAETLLACSNNAGPLFIVGAVGIGMLNSFKAGILLWGVNLLSVIIISLCLKPYTLIKHISENESYNNKSLTTCICESVSGILNVCGYIVLFSVINVIFKPLFIHFPPNLDDIIPGIIEISVGINSICKNIRLLSDKLPAISFILGWSGISVHMQVKSLLSDCNLSLKKYYISRTLIGLSSCLITGLYTGWGEVLIIHIPLSLVRGFFYGVSILCIILIILKAKKPSRKIMREDFKNN